MTADDVVLVFDGRTTRLLPAPPEWWWDLVEALDDLEEPPMS